MTRSFGASTSNRHRMTRRTPAATGPRCFTRLGFSCHRLVAIHDRDHDEPAFAPIELCETRNAMGAFMLLR